MQISSNKRLVKYKGSTVLIFIGMHYLKLVFAIYCYCKLSKFILQSFESICSRCFFVKVKNFCGFQILVCTECYCTSLKCSVFGAMVNCKLPCKQGMLSCHSTFQWFLVPISALGEIPENRKQERKLTTS
jgi:hypothetical protein